MLVMKFGGTSVGNAEAIKRVAAIVAGRVEFSPAVVVSAVAKTTDELVSLGRYAEEGNNVRCRRLIEWIAQKHLNIAADLELGESVGLKEVVAAATESLRRLSDSIMASREEDWPSLHDECLSTGEFLSCNILAEALRQRGVNAVWVDSRKVVVTDSRFGRARPSIEASEAKAKDLVAGAIQRGQVPVFQGFIGADSMGRVTTLGRGGSDYSATFLAAAIGADAVEVWTDVDGIMTADPSLVPEARCIRWMTFQEAAELAYFGAKVLHPSTILPAVQRGIPVRVLNSMVPDEEGTEIVPNLDESQNEPGIVKSIAYKEGLTVLVIRSTRMLMAYGFLAFIFELFNRYETSIDLVATSEVSVSVTVDNLERIDEILPELSNVAEVEISHEKAIVCLVGESICKRPGMVAEIFGELENVRMHMISQGASEINISFVIDESDLPLVINRLHKRFFSGPLDESLFAGPKEVSAG